MHHSAIRHNRNVRALARHARLAKRHRVIRAGIWRAIVRLPVKMLVFKEQHRIIRPNRCAQQSAHIERRRRHNHAQPRNMSEDHLAALAVVNRTARQITANRDPDNNIIAANQAGR